MFEVGMLIILFLWTLGLLALIGVMIFTIWEEHKNDRS